MSGIGRFLGVILLCSALAASAAGSSLICMIAGGPQQVRSEGLAERMGEITLTCGGGAPGQVINDFAADVSPAQRKNQQTINLVIRGPGLAVRRQLGQAGRQTIIDRYTIEANIAAHERLYREVCGKSV